MQNISQKSYRVDFSAFRNVWLVVKVSTGIAQSAWTNRADANSVASTLNWAAA